MMSRMKAVSASRIQMVVVPFGCEVRRLICLPGSALCTMVTMRVAHSPKSIIWFWAWAALARVRVVIRAVWCVVRVGKESGGGARFPDHFLRGTATAQRSQLTTAPLPKVVMFNEAR